MEYLFFILTSLALLIWISILLLPWQPWRNTEILEIDFSEGKSDLSDVTVVIPARDEAEVIETTLSGLVEQGEGLRIILVDDNSRDGTSEKAKKVKGLNLQIIPGEALPDGWSGKLWALDQGIRNVKTKLTLLLDADIHLGQGVIASLKKVIVNDDRQLVSVMASLKMENFWEKLLLPAFIYFFKMIYPFKLAKSRFRQFASAAGGCILLETRLLDEIGGLVSIKTAVIDDCTLAQKIKQRGHRLWIGQSREVDSSRSYTHLRDIWSMVTRTAYTQLLYSPIILIGLTLVMVIMFWMPVIGLFYPNNSILLISLLAWVAMLISYLPTIRYYDLNRTWVLTMPVIGTMYILMTWHSALRYLLGERSRWKGRIYRN